MSDKIAPQDLPLDPREAPEAGAGGDGSATYFRLSEDAWAAIVAAYQAGATAKELAAKWRVSPGSVYRHVGAAGCTKAMRGAEVGAAVLAAEAGRRVEARAGEAREAEAPSEHDPIAAAAALMRRAAGAAMAGRLSAAAEGLKLAEGLARVGRLLAAEGGGPRRGPDDDGDDDDEDEDDDADAGLSDAARAAQRAAVMAEFDARVGRLNLPAADSAERRPPRYVPMYANLELAPEYRPLAEAMGLVGPGDVEVRCPDFTAAMAKARRRGRGDLIDRVLDTPLAQLIPGWPRRPTDRAG